MSSSKVSRYLILAIALFLFSYSAYRAYYMSFTHDESFSFQNYFKSGWVDILLNRPPCANNHILNSLLGKAFSGILGDYPFVFRLSSLIGFVLYLISAFWICTKHLKPVVAVGTFVLLSFNPYLLDFFSLARGYGLSIGCMMVSLSFLIKYIHDSKQRYVYGAICFAALSVWGINSMVYFYASLIVVFNLIFLKANEGLLDWFKKNIPLFIVSVFLVALIIVPVYGLIKNDQLYFTRFNGFWTDTLGTLVQASFYGQNYYVFQIEITKVVTLCFLTFATGLSLFRYLKYKQIAISEILILVLLITILMIELHNVLNRSGFLIYRTSLFFYPILILVCVFIGYRLNNIVSKFINSGLIVIFSVLLIIHFFNSFNIKSVNEWQYDASTKDMLKDVRVDMERCHWKGSVDIGIHWTFEPTINFYRITHHINWLVPATHDGFERLAQYYYIYQEDSAWLYANKKNILKRYPEAGTILAKTKIEK